MKVCYLKKMNYINFNTVISLSIVQSFKTLINHPKVKWELNVFSISQHSRIWWNSYAFLILCPIIWIDEKYCMLLTIINKSNLYHMILKYECTLFHQNKQKCACTMHTEFISYLLQLFWSLWVPKSLYHLTLHYSVLVFILENRK